MTHICNKKNTFPSSFAFKKTVFAEEDWKRCHALMNMTIISVTKTVWVTVKQIRNILDC